MAGFRPKPKSGTAQVKTVQHRTVITLTLTNDSFAYIYTLAKYTVTLGPAQMLQ
jgi:hypothetical protein